MELRMSLGMADWEAVKSVLDEAPVAVFARDPDGRYVYVNRAFTSVAGQPVENILGRTAADILPAEVAQDVVDSDREVIENRRALLMEKVGIHGARRRTYTDFKFPLLDAEGRAFAVVGIGTDVTDRRSTERALQDSALAVSSAGGDHIFQELTRYLATILRCELALIGTLAGDGMVRTLGVYGLGAYRENFEYPLAVTPCRDVIGKAFMVVPGGVQALYPDDVHLERFNAIGYAGYPLNDAQGRAVGVLAILSRKPLVKHHLIESVMKIFAVRAEAELERARAADALRASEEQYRAIFNGSEDSIVLWNSEPRRVDVNAAYERLYGYTRDEVLAPDYGSALSREHAEGRMHFIRRSLAGERCEAEVEAVRKNGERFHINLRTIPVRYRGEPHVLAIGRDITGRRRAEEALKASEEQYRAIFNASEDAMVLWNSSLQRVDINPAYERVFGYPREEVISPDYNARLPHEHKERREGLVRRTLAGERCHDEFDSVRKDGTPIRVEVRTVPVRHLGEPHVLAMVRDVTERRRAEEALRRSEAQYRAIFNATEDAFVLRDAAFRIVDVNAAYERVSGYTRDEVLGADRVIANPGMQDHIRTLHDQALAGEPFMIETVRRTKDGRDIDVELRGVPIQHRGEPHVLYIGRDISRRKRAEEVRRASEEQYRAIFDATTDAIILRDAEGRIVDVNPALLRLSGYSREEVLSDPAWLFAAPEYRRTMRQMHDRARDGETILFEIKGLAKDGTLREIEVQCVPITYRGQLHILAMARDIGARKRAAEERLSLERQLRQAQKMEALGHLTGGIAHDFNNLLASIMGYVALAAERLETAPTGDAKLPGYLDEALLGCRRARDLVHQMLTFSRGQRGAARPIALPEAVTEALKLVRSSLPATVDIRSALESTASVLLDPVQLDQVLLNLSINARDAMEGAGRLAFSVKALRGVEAVCSSCRKGFRGNFAELAVEDSGPGIAPEVLERMFEPFFTTKEGGRGSGMGLATVHGIVHEHGGHVVVERGRVIGTRFRVLLPLLADGEAAAPVAVAPAASPRRAPIKGRVLVVDDEASVGQYMRELLESWGLEAAACTSGRHALEHFANGAPVFDVVVTDQTMPGMTGLQLARELAARTPGLPVVLYSGHIDRVTERESADAGIRAMLDKPVEPDRLYGVLKSFLN